jgi:soluble lytic murein transglycosylase-like protein
MQIESCGDPQAVSHAGAQGLFQVMPFHFAAGEVMLDPDTNAARGLAYYAERLQQTGGDVFQAFAGYNGGHVAAAGNWNTWANETQRYYTWSKGIYEDAKSGTESSTTLQQWMQAGGASLCQQASTRLNLK